MLYLVHNDKSNHEFVTSLTGVMEVRSRTKKVATPESKSDPGPGVDCGESEDKLVPLSVKSLNTNKLRETKLEFIVDNLADDDVIATGKKVVKEVEPIHPFWRPSILATRTYPLHQSWLTQGVKPNLIWIRQQLLLLMLRTNT